MLELGQQMAERQSSGAARVDESVEVVKQHRIGQLGRIIGELVEIRRVEHGWTAFP